MVVLPVFWFYTFVWWNVLILRNLICLRKKRSSCRRIWVLWNGFIFPISITSTWLHSNHYFHQQPTTSSITIKWHVFGTTFCKHNYYSNSSILVEITRILSLWNDTNTRLPLGFFQMPENSNTLRYDSRNSVTKMSLIEW